MTSPLAEPLILAPRFDPKIWGGRRLETVLGKALPDEQHYGESLESDDQSRVVSGTFAGVTIRYLIDRNATSLLGERGMAASGEFSDFPLLAKFIDASDVLSVQVHPNDEEAASIGKRGKTEAWHIIAADSGSKLITGIKPGVAIEQVERAIAEVDLGAFVIEQPVKAGDTLLVPAGTTHAIGAGILLYEIQQASDVTYRMYDWGRLDDAGQPRDLHVAESLSVVKPELTADVVLPLEFTPGRTMLTACRYFALERWDLGHGPIQREIDGGSFLLVSVISGSARLTSGGESVDVDTGQTALIPAGAPSLSATGDAIVLVSYVPDLESDVIAPLLRAGHSEYAIASLSGSLDDLKGN